MSEKAANLMFPEAPSSSPFHSVVSRSGPAQLLDHLRERVFVSDVAGEDHVGGPR